MAPSCLASDHPSGVLSLISLLWDALEPAAMLSWMIPCTTACSALGHGAGIRAEQRPHQLTRQLTPALGCVSHLSCSLAPHWQPGMQKQHRDTLLPVLDCSSPLLVPLQGPSPRRRGGGAGQPCVRTSSHGVMLKPTASISDFRFSCIFLAMLRR